MKPDAVRSGSLTRQAEAEREKRAKVVHAEREFTASQQLAAAAEVIGSQPATLQLRYLQTLTEIAAEKNSIIVFPLPLDLLQGFSQFACGGPKRCQQQRVPRTDLPMSTPTQRLVTYRRDRMGECWHIVPAGEFGPRGRTLCGEPRQGTRLSEGYAETQPGPPECICQRCSEADRALRTRSAEIV